MSLQIIEELVNEFHDYWQRYGNDKASCTDREGAMLKEFLVWLIGKGFIDSRKLTNKARKEINSYGQAREIK